MSYSGVKQQNTDKSRAGNNKTNMNNLLKYGISFVYLNKEGGRFLVEKKDGFFITPLTEEVCKKLGFSSPKKISKDFLEKDIYYSFNIHGDFLSQ
jgi:hypothetical protein